MATIILLTGARVEVIQRDTRFAYLLGLTLGIPGVPNCVHRTVRGKFKYQSARSALLAGVAALPEQVQDFTDTVQGKGGK